MPKKVKNKFIDLRSIPTTKSGQYNWKNSIGRKVPFIYDDIEGIIEIIDSFSINGQAKLKIKYNNYVSDILTASLIGCNLGIFLNKITTNFKLEINTRLTDKNRDIIITDRKYELDNFGATRKYYKYKCNKCGFNCNEHWSTRDNCYKNDLWIIEASLLRGTGCSCCSNAPTVVVEGINDIPTTAPWMIPYFQGGYGEAKKYSSSSNKKIYPRCPDCERIKSSQVPISSLKERHGFICECSDRKSIVSKYVFSILEQLKKNHQISLIESEVKYDWNKYKTFDGVIHQASIDYVIHFLDKNGFSRIIPVEADGLQHIGYCSFYNMSPQEAIYIDKQRDENCLNHLCENTIRILECPNMKEGILKSKLNELFDLNVIDWDEASSFSYKNLLKEACEIKRNNDNLSTIDIAKQMNVHYGTIREWLKIGSSLGWCNYNAKREMDMHHKKSREQIILTRSKPIEVFKDGVSCGIFQSASYLERESMEIFGVKFYSSNISKICNGKLKTSKGYTFKYA